MKKIYKFIISTIVSVFCNLLTTAYAQAQLLTNPEETIGKNAQDVGTKAGFDQGVNIGTIAQYFIQAFLSLLGIIFLAMILYGGYIWMIAGGDESKVQKAKDTIWRAVIGIIIVVSAYGITYFVFNYLGGTGSTGVGGGSGG